MKQAQDVYKIIWDMTSKLHGKVDVSEYKNYILPFMFYRYLSEYQDKYLTENGLEGFYTETNTDTIDECLQVITTNIGYAINPEFTWTAIIDKIDKRQIVPSDIKEMLEGFRMNAVRNASSIADFKSLFHEVVLGDNRFDVRFTALIDVIKSIDRFNYKDENGRDISEDIYELLIFHLAKLSGRTSSSYYTPPEVSQILAKIVTNDVDTQRKHFKVYDPTMGSGSLLLTVQKEFSSRSIDGNVDLYGQELNAVIYNLAKMNIIMHKVQYHNMHLRRGDTLDLDWPFIEKDGVQTPRKFDAVVANPPYSIKWNTKEIKRKEDNRFKNYAIAPSSRADYAFILHSLHHLDDNGTMAIVFPHGVLFREASEGKIRKKLIEENLLDAVISLPNNLLYETSIQTCILVFKGCKARKTNDVLFIDASNEFAKSRTVNILTKEHIDKIIDAYSNRVNIKKYAYVASLDEIKLNDFKLNISRYMDTFEEEIES